MRNIYPQASAEDKASLHAQLDAYWHCGSPVRGGVGTPLGRRNPPVLPLHTATQSAAGHMAHVICSPLVGNSGTVELTFRLPVAEICCFLYTLCACAHPGPDGTGPLPSGKSNCP